MADDFDTALKIAEGTLIAQARQLFSNWPILAAANTLGYAAAVLCRDTARASFLAIWLALLTLLAVTRLGMWHRMRRLEFDMGLARRIVAIGVGGAVISGLLWGFGFAYLLVGATALQRSLILLSAMGLSVSAIFGYGSHYPTFLAFYIPGILSLVPTLAFEDSFEGRWLAVGMTVFIGTVAMLARNFNQLVVQSIAHRFDSAVLVEQLTVRKDVAEAANLSKSRFLAAASHDLAQPMNALNLYLGALGGIDLPVPARTLCANVGQCAQSINGLLASLLDVSKLDAGALRPEPCEFMMETILERIRIEFEPSARVKHLDLRIKDCSLWVYGDPTLIERIVRNLVSNAVRYTARGKVLVACRRKSGKLRVSVYDTGIGIPEDAQRLIFEEFVQLGNAQRDREQGIGLGLSIVDRLARLQGLPIELRSTVGAGSVFTVDIPLAEAITTEDLRAEPVADDHPVGMVGRTIVVVDDEPLIRSATTALLEGWGCRVITASSGEEALKLLGNSPVLPDLLLCDYRLGNGMDGIEVVRALREEFNQDLPALLVTGDTASHHLREFQESGLTILHKPVRAEMLREAMTSALSARGLELESVLLDELRMDWRKHDNLHAGRH
jgi:two-component system, sensor histidine kinase